MSRSSGWCRDQVPHDHVSVPRTVVKLTMNGLAATAMRSLRSISGLLCIQDTCATALGGSASRCISYRLPNFPDVSGHELPSRPILYQVLNLPRLAPRRDWGRAAPCGRIEASCPHGGTATSTTDEKSRDEQARPQAPRPQGQRRQPRPQAQRLSREACSACLARDAKRPAPTPGSGPSSWAPDAVNSEPSTKRRARAACSRHGGDTFGLSRPPPGRR